jgi:hypothetical protein
MTTATIRVGENHATISNDSKGYLVTWKWLTHDDKIHFQDLKDALVEWHRKADAIKALAK